MDNMSNNMSNANDRNIIELIAEREGTEAFGKPCECVILEGQGPFEFIASPIDGERMCIGLPIAVADLPEYIAGFVFREVFKAMNGDPTARPSAALNAAYHTMAEAMVDEPCFMRDPALDDAMAMYIDAGLVPDYSTAFVFKTSDITACAMPLHFACSCALSARLVETVKASTATCEEETRLLALALAQTMGLVMSGRTGRDGGKDDARPGLELAQAIGIREEEFGKLLGILKEVCGNDE